MLLTRYSISLLFKITLLNIFECKEIYMYGFGRFPQILNHVTGIKQVLRGPFIGVVHVTVIDLLLKLSPREFI